MRNSRNATRYFFAFPNPLRGWIPPADDKPENPADPPEKPEDPKENPKKYSA
jgi:hypothetical protein